MGKKKEMMMRIYDGRRRRVTRGRGRVAEADEDVVIVEDDVDDPEVKMPEKKRICEGFQVLEQGLDALDLQSSVFSLFNDVRH